MKNIAKSTFREIKSSFGRFVAILAIIALGVGFFAGLKVARSAMLTTMKGYFDESRFYDFRIISTLGLTEEDVDFFREQEDVAYVQGAVSFDVLYSLEDGTEGAVKTFNLPDEMNTVKLTAGRLPLHDTECVADSNMLDESAIGSTITLIDRNEEDTLAHFSYRTYTITGLVRSPLYIQFERGNTSLGTGRLDGFLYLRDGGFDVDCYTDIYVRFQQDYALYADEYTTYIEEQTKRWEGYAELAGQRRYQSVRSDAETELDDAGRELADKKKEGEEELADARAELDDAAAKIVDGEQKLADARRELEAGKKALADGEKTIEAGKEALADGRSTLEDQQDELEENEKTLSEQARSIEEAEQTLAESKRTLTENRTALEERRQELEAAAAYMDPQLLAAAQAELALMQEELDAAQEELDASEQALKKGKKELAKAQAKLEAGKKKLASAKDELDQKGLELARAEQELEKSRTEISDGERELAKNESELADAKRELSDGEQDYREAQEEFAEKIADAEAELADAEREVRDLKEPDTYVLGRDTNIGYVCFENDSDIVEGIAVVFPVFFFLVAALVCITTMNRMVEEQRTQIGVLKALGYTGGAIMSKYMVYSGLAAVIGCVLGFALGTWAFPKVIWYAYGIMYKTEPIVYVFNLRLALLSLFVSLVCSVGATWLSCRVELSEVAAQLMRPKAPKAGKRVFLERIPFVWRHLSFLRKVSVRNIFRYKKRLFMMVLGISGCTALLVTGFGIKDSIADVADRQFEDIQIYDLGITFQESVDESICEELDTLSDEWIRDYLCVTETNMDLLTERGTKSVYLVAADAVRMADYVDMHTKGGNPIAYPGPGEGVVTQKLAEEYRIKAGDTISLQNEEMQKMTVKVSAVMENYIYNYVYISEDTWQQAYGTAPESKRAYVNAKNGVDVHALSAKIMDLDKVASVTVNRDTVERVGSMMSSLNLIVLVVIFCAAGLAFIVLYNLTNINITERIREIATIKVLGFYKRETASYVFRENLLLTILGMLLGLGLGRFLHAFVMSRIQIDLIAFDVRVKTVSYVYSAVLTVGFAWLVNLGMGGRLERISMTESLKSVD